MYISRLKNVPRRSRRAASALGEGREGREGGPYLETFVFICGRRFFAVVQQEEGVFFLGKVGGGMGLLVEVASYYQTGEGGGRVAFPESRYALAP